MPKKLKIATWNIAGARKMRSLEMFDYEGENVAYFADELKKIDPDIVCLQEAHTSKKRGVAYEIAKLLGMEFVYNSPVSPSHIDKEYQLGNAVIAKQELRPLEDVVYPFPEFGKTFANGQPAQHHDKVVNLFDCNGLMIANTQVLPAGVFGKKYTEGEGAELAAQMQDKLLEHLKPPVVLCGDFEVSDLQAIFPKLYAQLRFYDLLPEEPTRPNKEGIRKWPDHIVASEPIKWLAAGVEQTKTDHFLCWAEIELPD